ncbi:MAG: phytoene/squalene synthase family protein [Rhodobacteraceae bacterium]|nr:phytoene/squalene synthase family protein [Paracoccaceae bacterium]
MTATSYITAPDMDACRAAIRTGSRSFHAASRLLPTSLRDPALVLYAFCRVADDAVDEGLDPVRAVLQLQDRLDRAYAGTPHDAPIDRAFAAMVVQHELPRALPDALLEGLAWDAEGRRFNTFSELVDYAARVAAVVGAMMCVLMGVRDRDRLARACDLGVAMQLTNIARDIGEDARNGRLYLPLAWFDDARLCPESFLRAPAPRPEIRAMTAQLLQEADRLYQRASAGISALPLACRPGIFAARHIYCGIGGSIRAQGHDSITRRAYTNNRQKLGWLSLSAAQAALSVVQPQAATLHARPLPETRFLVDAASRDTDLSNRSQTLIDAMARLRARDISARQSYRDMSRRSA